MDRRISRTRHLASRADMIAQWLSEAERAPEEHDAVQRLRETISELRTAEEEIRQQNEELMEARINLEFERERFRELFDFAPDAYLVTDMHGVISDANLAAEDLFRRPRRTLLRKPLRLFVPVDDKTPFYTILEQLGRSGRVEDVQLTISPQPRELAHLSVSARVYPRNGAPPEGIRWQLRNITERFMREEEIRHLNADLEDRVRERTAELTRANAAKDEFLGLISHELKTPITVIGGNAEALSRHGDALTPDQRAAALADVRDEADRLHRIIDNLLVLARLERGQEIGREPLRLDLLVTARARDHRTHFPTRLLEVADGRSDAR
jgi:PAS domain S-box-containing protein